MDIDDPLFAEAYKLMIERVERYDERILTVIKCHLAVEQALNSLLAVARRRWRNRKFMGKFDIAKGLFVKEMTEELWAVLKIGNDLRSAIAHGDKQGKVEAKMNDLRTSLIAASTTSQKDHIGRMSEKQLIMSAFYLCSSHLIVAADRIGKEKAK